MFWLIYKIGFVITLLWLGYHLLTGKDQLEAWLDANQDLGRDLTGKEVKMFLTLASIVLLALWPYYWFDYFINLKDED